jgi:quinoprotein glucose dehydrogenase
MDVSSPPRNSLASKISGAVFVVLGLPLALGGMRLVSLGGSSHYLLAGLVTLVVGVLLFLRRPAALWLHAALLLATLAWALWESGLDLWPLMPRTALWFVLALWLLLPWVRRSLAAAAAADEDRPRTRGAWALWLGVVLSLVVWAAAAVQSPHDHPGQLPMDAAVASPGLAASAVQGEWPSYGGSPYGQRYSALNQITPQNVSQLKELWHYRTGDVPGPGDPTETTDEVTPIKVHDTLYLCTPHSIAIALDPATGRERWRFDPHLQSPVGFKHFEHMTCRGVSYHEDPPTQSSAANAECPRRIFLPTADARLIALDADTGKPCAGFGQGGTVNLLQNLIAFEPGGYYSTSPPVVTQSLVVIGGHVSDNKSTREPSGVMRAYDVHDGHLVWNWDAGNPDHTEPIAPGQLYTNNSPNMWSVASVDESLGMVYLPMGNQTPDQWGGQRTPQSERFSAGVVALDLATGRVRWVHQFTHHDLWDMDVGGQPSLVDIATAQGVRPALVASTKQGSLYVLDRRTGEAIVPIEERPVPQGAAPGDRTSPTQPFSALSLSPPNVREADMWGATPYDQLWCRITFRSLRYEGMFTPPSEKGSLVNPGNFGVLDWGGVSVDPVRQLVIANPSYVAFISRLIPKGSEQGGAESKGEANGIKHVQGIPFDIELKPFLSPLHIPCQQPPWGYVAGIDLRQGRVAWMHKNGTIRDSSPVPVPVPLGVPSLGGTMVTAGGVAFLSGTLDYYVRGYEVQTGRQLWKARLPAGGQATPMSYADRNGKQVVVVVAGGHGSLGTRQGDHVIAYALP